ncbi:MAG: dienelactone hydrolase family protein [Planctomycetaceae bacterium]
MPPHHLTLGGLDCQVYDELPRDAPPRIGVVLCHGFGAPATDLVPLAPALLRLEPGLREFVRFVFPAAPLSLDAEGLLGGRAWWPLDIQRLVLATEQSELRDLREEIPKGLQKSSDLLTALVDEWSEGTGLSMDRIVLGGFSQGAMLATDVSLRLPERPGALCVFSGTLTAEPEWRDLAALRGALPVFQSHGLQDPLLPFEAAEWLRDMFLEAGLPVDFLPFEGGHTIPQEALVRVAALLERLIAEEEAEEEIE